MSQQQRRLMEKATCKSGVGVVTVTGGSVRREEDVYRAVERTGEPWKVGALLAAAGVGGAVALCLWETAIR